MNKFSTEVMNLHSIDCDRVNGNIHRIQIDILKNLPQALFIESYKLTACSIDYDHWTNGNTMR